MPDHVATDPLDPPDLAADGHAEPVQPEPVLDAARVASTINGAVAAVSGAAVLWGVGNQQQWTALEVAVGAAVTAVVTLVTVATPLWQAVRARRHVTPIASPVSASGEQLVSVSAASAIVSARAANAPLPQGQPTQITEPGADNTVVERFA